METASPIDVAALRRSTRVLVADDHELVRRGLVCLLDLCGYQVVAQASNGQEAVALWQKLKPDISLLDLRMPVLDGIGAINAIRAVSPQARIVVLSTFDGTEQVTRALDAGARAYLLKAASPDMLCSCIDSVHCGENLLVPELAHRSTHHCVTPSRARHTARPVVQQLSSRERSVLALIAQGKSNKGVARELDIAAETVKAHLKRVFVKLGSRTRAESVARATALGWIAGGSDLLGEADASCLSIDHAAGSIAWAPAIR